MTRFQMYSESLEMENSEDELPKIASDRREYYKEPYHVPQAKSDDITWAVMRWMVILLNFAAGTAFVVDLLYGQYDYVKHITIMTTMCASYFALTWVQNNNLRDD